MKYKKEGIVVGKVKSIVSGVYGIVMWVTRLSSLMQTSKALPAYQYLQLGLGALICSTAENMINHSACSTIHSYIISPSPSSSSPSSGATSSLFNSLPRSSSWSSMMGDLIGTESGVMMSSDQLLQETKPYRCSSSRSKRNQRCEIKREYPPPMPSLQGGCMPRARARVLTRNCFNGRLILREEKVHHYEYLEVKRENGRLLLNIIPVVNDDDEELDHNYKQVPAHNDDQDRDGKNWKQHHHDENQTVVQKESMIIVRQASSMPEINGSPKEGYLQKCLAYAGSTMSNSSFFNMPIPVNKLIHV